MKLKMKIRANLILVKDFLFGIKLYTLRSGMIVRMRNGTYAMVFRSLRGSYLKTIRIEQDGSFLITPQAIAFSSYNWRMIHKASFNFDITKVMKMKNIRYEDIEDFKTVWYELYTMKTIERQLRYYAPILCKESGKELEQWQTQQQ